MANIWGISEYIYETIKTLGAIKMTKTGLYLICILLFVQTPGFSKAKSCNTTLKHFAESLNSRGPQFSNSQVFQAFMCISENVEYSLDYLFNNVNDGGGEGLSRYIYIYSKIEPLQTIKYFKKQYKKDRDNAEFRAFVFEHAVSCDYEILLVPNEFGISKDEEFYKSISKLYFKEFKREANDCKKVIQ